MYFIDEVVREIWKKDALLFKKAYDDAMNMNTQDLFNILCSIKIDYYEKDFKYLNVLPTCGCSYHICDIENMSGCSMCNLHTNYQRVAMLKALRDKDVRLYAQIIRSSFINARGIVDRRTIVEQIICHNSLDKYEMPDEVLEELFGNDGVYKKKPLLLEIETNISSINKSRILKLQRYMGRSTIWFRLGIECGNEWIRGHWLNKRTTNNHILDTVEFLHSIGYKITANILLGIPGLTEEQSLQQFKDTVEWTNRFADMYNISLLNIRENTIQWYLNDKLQEHIPLKNIGIAQGKHTGLPWLFTLVTAICWALKNIPGFSKKILAIGQFFDDKFDEYNVIAYNKTDSCQCYEKIYGILKKLVVDKKWEEILELENWMKTDKCYMEYLELVEKQKNAGDIKNTIRIEGGEIARSMWPGEYERRIERLDEELRSFNLFTSAYKYPINE